MHQEGVHRMKAPELDVREDGSWALGATVQTDEGPLRIVIGQNAPGQEVILSLHTGPDQDGHGMRVLMDGVPMDFVPLDT
jgi:ABC-type uncharacterized transport system ATPase subunit